MTKTETGNDKESGGTTATAKQLYFNVGRYGLDDSLDVYATVMASLVSKIINNKDEKYPCAIIDFCFLIFIGRPNNCSAIFLHFFLPVAAGTLLASVTITQKNRTWYKALVDQCFIRNTK